MRDPLSEADDPGVSSSAEGHLRTVARGAGLNLVGSAVSALAGFGLVVVVARLFDTEVSGLFFAASAVFLILAGLTGLGAEAGLARFALRLEHEGRAGALPALFTRALVVVLACSVAAGLGAVLLAGVLADLLGWQPYGASLLRLIGLGLPFAVLAEFGQAGTRAFGRMQETVVIDRLFRAVAQVMAVVAANLAGAGVTGLLAAWLAVYPLAALWSLLALRRFLSTRVPSSTPAATPPMREFWAFTWPRALSVVARLGIQKVDVVLVAALLSPTDAALYAAATRFVALGQIVAIAINQVMQPRYTALLLEESRSDLSTVHQTASAWTVLLSWPLYLVVGCAPEAYLGIFGPDFVTDQARTVVLVMAAVMLLASATGPVDTLLVMAGGSRTSMVNALLALGVDVGGCLLLIPRFGIVGAAAAWGSAVLVRVLLAVFFVRREVGVRSAAPVVALAAATGLVAVGVPVLAFTLLGWPWLAGIAVAVVCYLLTVAGARRRLELDVLVAALARRKGGLNATAATDLGHPQ